MKPPREGNTLRSIARNTDRQMQIDPSPAVKDQNTLHGLPPKNPHDDEQGLRRGGKVKHTGPVKAHKGEQVVKRASAEQYGDRKMAAVNRGTAKVTAPKRR